MLDELFLAEYLYVLDVLAAITAVLILVSSLDDLFIDICYWVRTAWRWAAVKSRYAPLRIEQLREKEESWLAIMVPAWKEYDVIAKMVENTLATMEYRNYVIFLGTYQNDAETTAEADRMARRFPHKVRRAAVAHDGPTCKADCLNWIVQSIFQYEEQNGMRFSGMVMHDSEDVIHPLEFHLYNYLIDRKDLIQLPVLSLEREWHEFIAGTYLDDFSEWHCKEMAVRESLTGLVPGSGVATCYSHRVIEELAKLNNNQPFNTDTLTEDYEMSHRLKKIGTEQVFVMFPVLYRAKRKGLFSRREKMVEVKSLIATREYFPSEFRAAYRQRARWILGVSFQGWQQMGWQGGLISNYLYFRDRKGIFTSFAGLLAYFLAANFSVLWMLHSAGYEYVRFPEFTQPESWIYSVILVNFWLFMNRIAQRVYFVAKLNGIEQGLLAIPRMLVGNVINFFSVCRAWKVFLIHIVTGKRVTWDKTQHSYPTMGELQRHRKLLGDLLLEWQAIEREHLDQALDMQKQTGKKLGQVLREAGLISEEVLADVVAEQSGLPRAGLLPDAVGKFAGRLPRYLVERYRAIPFADGEGGSLNLAVAEPLSQEALAEMQGEVAEPLACFIVCEAEIADALDWYNTGAAPRSVGAKNKRPLLGDVLLGMGALSLRQFESAMGAFEAKRDGLIGEYLVGRHLISRNQLEQALLLQRQNPQAVSA
ncbi:MAG TPA: glycosyl transferase family protein [Gallionella sp.]|nr:glycosyl transferase family protein [Gallionella sp.]